MEIVKRLMMGSSSIFLCSILYGQIVCKSDEPKIVIEEYGKVFGKSRTLKVDLEKAPNILLITSDQQSWEAISCHDNTIKTPNLDRLVKAGVSFDRAYTCNPVSTPTRASIITGMYPSQHGAYA